MSNDAQRELRWCSACQAPSEGGPGLFYCRRQRRSSMGVIVCGAVVLKPPVGDARFQIAEAAYRLGGLAAAEEAYRNWTGASS